MNVAGPYWWEVNIGAWCHQAITWANVELDLCRHTASLSLNELNS